MPVGRVNRQLFATVAHLTKQNKKLKECVCVAHVLASVRSCALYLHVTGYCKRKNKVVGIFFHKSMGYLLMQKSHHNSDTSVKFGNGTLEVQRSDVSKQT